MLCCCYAVLLLTAQPQMQGGGKGKLFFLITNKSLARLISRVKKDTILYGKVMKIIAQDKILLRLLDIDVIAVPQSGIRFEEGEELTLWVKKSGLPIVLEALRKSTLDKGINILG